MISTLQPHIRLGVENGASYALLPGDPQRVDKVKKWLTDVEDLAFNREYKTISGFYKNVKILVTSTGIGGPSLAIALEELKNIGVNTMIRIGSCGALNAGIKLGELIIPSGAVRDEGTSEAYIEKHYPAIPDTDLLNCLLNSAKKFNFPFVNGIIRSHDSFYTDREEEKKEYWSKRGIIASDMETSVLFVVGKIKALNVASILNVVVEAGGDTSDGINNYVDGQKESELGEDREIKTALEAIFEFNNQIIKEKEKSR